MGRDVRPGRFLTICVLALGLAPGTWLRESITPPPGPTTIILTPLDERDRISGRLPVTGAWVLDSDHPDFGGISAMVHAGANDQDASEALILATDRGWMLRLPLAGGEPRGGRIELSHYVDELDLDSDWFDLEALARDPATGTLWSAYENVNSVVRDDFDNQNGSRHVGYKPTGMREWRINRGAETLVRLADGRFIALAEGAHDSPGGTRTHAGLLFARDPVAEQAALQFRFNALPGFAPVDGTALPDGRVLILLRRVRYALPVRFDAAVMLANPAEIAGDDLWSGEIIARLRGSTYSENFEGIAFVPSDSQESAAGSIYIVSDDNFSVFQRTLLMRLAWPETG